MWSDLLTFFSGVLASFLAWLLVTQVIRPRIELPQTIERGQALVQGRHTVYRLKVKNRNWFFGVFDIALYGRIRICGLDEQRPQTAKTFLVSVGNKESPYIRAWHGKDENIKSFVIRVPQKGQLKKLYMTHHAGHAPAPFVLDDVFSIAPEYKIELEVSLICTHAFTGARSIATKVYTAADIVEEALPAEKQRDTHSH